MIKWTSRWLPLACLIGVGGLLPWLEGCGPRELTHKRVRALIVEQKLPKPVESFSYSLDDPLRRRMLRACAEAGLITIAGEAFDLTLRLTPLGEEHIRSVAKTKVGDTYRYTLFFRTPVPSRLIDITAIRDYGPKYKQVGYTWQYDCPPILESCTTLNGERQTGSAKIIAWGSKWKVK